MNIEWTKKEKRKTKKGTESPDYFDQSELVFRIFTRTLL